MDGRHNHRSTPAFSNVTGVVWTGPERTDKIKLNHFRVEY